MAFGYYMNMEKMSLEIAGEHIELMEENIQDMQICEFLDIDKLIRNIKDGFVVITQLITFVESFFNTIINTCMQENNELLLKMSIDEKLEIICLYYKVKSSQIKSIHYWGTFRTINKVRNELIHYKKSFICDCTAIQDFNIAGISVKEFFIKSNMDKIMEHIIQLGNHISKVLGLTINKDVSIIECDARDGLVSYVFDDKIIDVDPSRNVN